MGNDENNDQGRGRKPGKFKSFFGLFGRRNSEDARTEARSPRAHTQSPASPASGTVRPKSVRARSHGTSREKPTTREGKRLSDRNDKNDNNEFDIENIMKEEKTQQNILKEKDIERFIQIGRRIIDEELVKQTEEEEAKKREQIAQMDEEAKNGKLDLKVKIRPEPVDEKTKDREEKSNVKTETSVVKSLEKVGPPSDCNGVQYAVEYRVVQGKVVTRYVPKKQ
ncbi:unnamed protein product [Bursaphelenchus okinawaensis]|uniref:Uncharacterized protein n=1 Tax=Bursaphelenchus okinawaensis TaxID=465554 RepID=A0A811LNG9_9BILA|nr:unnamed protein product [Bursaphelenchus okinawaensis]CAG9124781.1 unnamed protein product [Bursaphelenchus okinawaensis]